jgi:sulfur-carrier protein
MVLRQAAMVTVHIPSPLRSFSNGRDRVDVEGETLRQVIESLDKECPGIKDRLIDDNASLRPGLALAIDDYYTDEGLLQRVPEGASVYILPALGGG